VSDDVTVDIRAAVPAEAPLLTEIAMRSKAHWGYSAEFLERCRPVLTVTAEAICLRSVFVATAGTVLLGFYAIADAGDDWELDLLFVEPQWIGTGAGALLLRHALAGAAAKGRRRLVVESDPQAEPFYLRFGGVRVGERESTVEAGRMLPVLAFDVGLE
jgi:GNAT superfamily N-acetyltransferase